jgi:hypothetical protein
MHSPGLGVVGPVHKTADPGMHDCSGAHGARFDGHEQVAAGQPVVSYGSAGRAQRHNLGMCGGIGIRQVAIKSQANDFSFVDHDSAHGDLSQFERALGSPQSLMHVEFVGAVISIISH